MKITFRIAFRNLIRQKRRNILLGSGIAFGIMVLFISQSYTKGLSDIMINSFISRIFGHIQINVNEKTNRSIPIIRDKNAVMETINRTIENVDHCWESVSTLTRAVGNGSGALMVVVGVEKSNTPFFNALRVVDGDLKSFTEKSTDTSIILYSPKAKELNVKAGDTVNIKLTTIYGQIQSARLTVAAIVKPENIFMTMAGFTSLDTIKSLLGYRPHETSRINIVLNHISKPEETVAKADLLHKAFKPKPVFINVTLTGSHGETGAVARGLDCQPDISPVFMSEFNLSGGIAGNFSKSGAVIIGRGIAGKLKAEVNDKIRLSYDTKYDGRNSAETPFTIVGVIDDATGIYADSVFFNASDFYKFYTQYLPQSDSDKDRLGLLTKREKLMEALVYDKTLLKRPKDSKEWKQLLRSIKNHRKPGSLMHITSMKETAEDVLKIESALNLICIVTVLILFAIILTGSVNAVRMTIRERTREIGTVRSIGMQKKQVVRIFILESALLSLFASLIGVGLALFIMFLLSNITFQVDNLFSILIDNGHLHFLPELKTGVADIIITVAVTVLTTWFPAKKAAAMPVTEALGHYE